MSPMNAMQIIYLGTSISSSGISLQEVKNQVININRTVQCLNYTIWYNKYQRPEWKLRIYKSVVKPILLYAVEIRLDSVKTRQ